MKLEFNVRLANQTDNLFFFMGEVHRLCYEHKNFIFAFKSGHKLYLETCKGIQKKAYACLTDREKIEPLITTLNYAVALQADLQLSLEHSSLHFEVSSSSSISKISAFADSLNVEYVSLD